MTSDEERQTWARALWAAGEPFTLGFLMAREARAAAADLGVPLPATFFALRGAPLGAASSAVATAAMHGLPFDTVDSVWSSLWERANPAAVIAAHHHCLATTAGRMMLGDVDPDRLRRSSDLLNRVVDELDTAGRTLAAANQSVPPPDEPWARFWRAANTLREYRGDGHIAVLLSADLDVSEALVLTMAWGAAHIDAATLRSTRQLGDDRVAAATNRLAARGLLATDGRLTTAGRALREAIERDTDRICCRAWAPLRATELRSLLELLTELSGQMVAGGHMRAVTAVGAPWPPPAP